MTQIVYSFVEGDWNRIVVPDAPDFYLIGETTQEYIRLGVKLTHRYKGPSVWRADGPYSLSEKMLSLLVGRFYMRNNFAFVKFMDFYTFDSEIAHGRTFAEFKEVGGERDDDVPLKAYLPELEDMKVEDYTVKEIEDQHK